MRRTIAAAILLLILVAGCSAPASPEPTDPPPTSVPPTDVAVPSAWAVVHRTVIDRAIRFAAFVNIDVGFTGGVGGDGKAHVTTDGGGTWTLAESSYG